MSDQTVFIPWDLAESFVTKVFEALGSPCEEAAVCADVILESDRRGITSHGINRMKPFYYDRVREGIQYVNAEFEIVTRTPSAALIDGHDGMGQYIGHRSMRLAVEIAKETGVGVVVTKNSSHFGIAGYYANMATREGLAAIVATNARPSIAPTFGVENMLGTNPLCIGIPTDEEFDFLIDCATSTFQRGKVEYLARSGKPLPEGMVIDHEGNSVTEAAAIMEGLAKGAVALTPLGGAGERTAGYKGYGYATAVELLCSAFTSSNYMKALLGTGPNGEKTKYHIGHFFIAIDTRAFTDEAVFRKNAGDVCRALRASEKAVGQERIYTAGEKEYLTWQELKKTGLPVPPSVQKELLQIRDELKLTEFDLPF